MNGRIIGFVCFMISICANAEITIRPGTMDDLDAVTHIRREVYKSAYGPLLPTDDARAKLEAIDFTISAGYLLSNTVSRTFVAVDSESNKAIGYITVGPRRAFMPLAETAPFNTIPGELQSFFILDTYQRMGIGSCLFAEGRRWLEANALYPMTVWVLRDNTPAVAAYQRWGGTITGDGANSEFLGTNMWHDMLVWK